MVLNVVLAAAAVWKQLDIGLEPDLVLASHQTLRWLAFIVGTPLLLQLGPALVASAVSEACSLWRSIRS